MVGDTFAPSTEIRSSPVLSVPSAGFCRATGATRFSVSGLPLIAYSPVSSTNAITTFTNGPAAITKTRFHTGIAKYARSRCSGAISSCGFIPVIRT